MNFKKAIPNLHSSTSLPHFEVVTLGKMHFNMGCASCPGEASFAYGTVKRSHMVYWEQHSLRNQIVQSLLFPAV